MNAATIAWLVLIFGFALPLAHVAFSAQGGPWRPPPEVGCPFSPRAGWFVIVLFLGPIGWLLYMRARNRHSPNS